MDNHSTYTTHWAKVVDVVRATSSYPSSKNDGVRNTTVNVRATDVCELCALMGRMSKKNSQNEGKKLS